MLRMKEGLLKQTVNLIFPSLKSVEKHRFNMSQPYKSYQYMFDSRSDGASVDKNSIAARSIFIRR